MTAKDRYLRELTERLDQMPLPMVDPPRTQTHYTVSCKSGQHNECYGYCAPLVYSNTRPCECFCHSNDNPRRWSDAYARARASYDAS